MSRRRGEPDSEERPGDGGPSTSAPRLAIAFAVGVTLTVVATVGLAVLSPWLLPVGAVAGAAATGYLGRVGRAAGTLLGATVTGVVGAGGLVAFWLVVTADPPRTGGAGLGLVVGFLFVAFFALVGVVLGGFGGLTGAVVRERRATDGRSDPPPVSDPGRPGAPSDAAPGDGTSTAAAVPAASTVLVGTGLAVATCFVPLAPVGAGAVAGYLDGDGRKRGATTGALAGVGATVVVVGGLLLFALLPLNILRPFIFEYFLELTLVLGAYFVGGCAAGGAAAGALSENRRRLESSGRSHRR